MSEQFFGLIGIAAIVVGLFWAAVIARIVLDRYTRKRVIEGFSGKLLSDTPAGKLGKSIIKDICPDCNGKGFYEGPSGGMSTNIYCRNPKCKSAFNFTNIFSQGHAERIGTAPDWFKYPGESRSTGSR